MCSWTEQNSSRSLYLAAKQLHPSSQSAETWFPHRHTHTHKTIKESMPHGLLLCLIPTKTLLGIISEPWPQHLHCNLPEAGLDTANQPTHSASYTSSCFFSSWSFISCQWSSIWHWHTADNRHVFQLLSFSSLLITVFKFPKAQEPLQLLGDLVLGCGSSKIGLGFHMA